MAFQYILLETADAQAIILEDGSGGLALDAVAAPAAAWLAGRIFDHDADNNTAANGALSASTPSTVDSANYSAADVSGREGTLYKNKINGHAAVYYGSGKGASIPALPAGLTSFSVGIVANQDAEQQGVYTRLISADINYLITLTRSDLLFYSAGTIASQTTPPITANTAHAALAEISPTGAALYIDGVLIGSAAGSFSIPAQIFLSWSVGGGGEPAMAFITRTIAWNKVLSATERAAWFANMKTDYATP